MSTIMKTEIMERNGCELVYELMVSNIVIAKEANVIRKKLEEAIDTYEASNKMPNSSAVISSLTFKEAIETMLKYNMNKTVQVTNASSSVAYRVELYMAETELGNATYYSVYADFYKYEEV